MSKRKRKNGEGQAPESNAEGQAPEVDTEKEAAPVVENTDPEPTEETETPSEELSSTPAPAFVIADILKDHPGIDFGSGKVKQLVAGRCGDIVPAGEAERLEDEGFIRIRKE